MSKIISIDAGRRGIKSAVLDNKGEFITKIFTAKFGNADFNFLKNTTNLSFYKIEDLIISVNGKPPIIIGDTCDKLLPPDEINYVTEDETYLEYSIDYILISVARFLENSDEIVDDIKISLNLTYNNINKKDEISEKLKNVQKVQFFDTKGNVIKEVKFQIVKLKIFFQGWCSIFYKSLDDEMKFDDKYFDDGIVIDCGRKTTDTTYVRSLDAVKGRSYNLGTENIFRNIKSRIYDEFNTSVNIIDIERYILDDEDITLRSGDVINLKEFLNEAIKSVIIDLKNNILEDFGNYYPKWIMLTGGGVYYFQNVLIQIFKNAEVLDEPIFSNTIGMIKMMKKFEK